MEERDAGQENGKFSDRFRISEGNNTIYPRNQEIQFLR
jgi:hypothetical protein